MRLCHSIILFFLVTSTFGQHVQCLQQGMYEPESQEIFIQTREKTHLTVVIHVLHRTSIDSISDEQILSQIDVLNEDFNQLNDNFDGTPAVFKEVAASVDVQFCLADKDPDGNPTTGITRTKTNIDDIGLTEAYYQTNLGGIDAWDPSRYINIWVADLGNSSISGSGTFPDQADPPGKDGILMSFKFFGREGVAEEFYPHDLGRICVHEMGHYFGLPHTFGTIGNGCNDDDGFNDTPLQDDPSFACPDFPAADICTQNNGVMFMNFMDYTDDACMTMFTAEQKNRIHQTLNGPRSSLKDNLDNICIVQTETPPETKDWNFFPNPAKDEIILEDEQYTGEKMSIYDTQGQLVLWAKALQRKSQISLSALQAGIYYVHYKNSFKKLLIVE